MAADGTAQLIAVDWGTSRLRAELLDGDGVRLAEADSSDGIGTLEPGEHEAAFERLVEDWPVVPAVMAGMIGSRQGWREAPYIGCPATPDELAAATIRFETTAGRPVAIVPGVMVRSEDRDGDVIRGEETQMVGLLSRPGGFDGLAILPGTHAKWAALGNGAIQSFQTFFTGELFDLLAHQSFLRHSVDAEHENLAILPDFALGVRRTVERRVPFLSAVFSVRARHLLDDTAPVDNRAYLSGLVIGGEIVAARDSGLIPGGGRIAIVGSRTLTKAYHRAMAIAGHETEAIDGRRMVIDGLLQIARSLGFLGGKDKP
ncbi:2-dehydro-3-deoxygalactonokinase [Bauldia sp.]|uniref:2-dehydro-3-deoxygalactonokinase n=1 Tax=Bauldia sp. TaxID=2575872 RepID=UPI003BAAB441